MKRSVIMYLRLSQQNVKARLEYKGDFIISTVAGTLLQTFGLVFIFVLFQNIRSVAGWNLYEVALLYGCIMMGEGAYTLLFQGVTGLTYHVRMGTFDRFMLRPLPLTTQLLGSQINFAGLGTMVTGAAVIAYSLARLPGSPGAPHLLLFMANVFLGIVIRVNINLAVASVSFWLIAAGGVASLAYSAQEFGKYPVTIYPLAVRVILFTVLPFAVISYVPVCLLVGRLALWPYALAVPASLVFITFLRCRLFSKAVKSYESSGS